MSIDRDDTYRDALEHYTSRCSTLNRYARNLTVQAAQGRLPRCYARDAEIESICISLRRHTRPNVMLTGAAGCGKTAIIEGLAQKFENELYQKWKKSKGVDYLSNLISETLPIVYELSAGNILGGAKYRGDFEERLQSIIDELKDRDRTVILFIDEAHLLTTLGEAEGAVSAANLLKPALARGDISIIAATTEDEYKKYLSKDKAFTRRFSRLEVKPIAGKARLDCALNILKEYADIFGIAVDKTINSELVQSVLDGPMDNCIFPCGFVDVVDQMFAEATYRSLELVTKAELQSAIFASTKCLVV